MPAPVVYFWKKVPFLRILLPFLAGIILQWYLQIPYQACVLVLIVSVSTLVFSFGFSLSRRFELGWLDGIAALFLFSSAAALLTFHNDIRHHKKWFGNFYGEKTMVVATLVEPLVEKTKSFKSLAQVSFICQSGIQIQTKGKIILYFKKDSSLLRPGYGSQIVFTKQLQEIRNGGNPGGFDYKTYCLFQQVTHQVFLGGDEYEIVSGAKNTDLKGMLFSTRDELLNIFRANIHGSKELGLSEALLIGYKDDLDKSLVQSYSNTGVVHIIAISGMHLALIYWLLNVILQPLSKRKKWKWLKPVLAISGLWLFSLLTGASASVIRAAVMFTFLIIGESISKKASVYNTLAASAFFLLCYNPFWLWDVGFQLSYSAVLSIVIFMKPVYNLLFFKNKLMDGIWKLNSVTLAAQILTTPLSIYHFHQFPVYFFLTNLVAVPLSSIIVLGEIFLCAISFVPLLARFTGEILTWLIRLMNQYVQRIEALPGSLWDGLQVNVAQVILAFIIIGGVSYWLLERSKASLVVTLFALLGFFIIRTSSFIHSEEQRQIIVYNIPQRRAIDLIDGRKYFFVGDPALLTDKFTANFHLKPSRTLYRITPASLPADVNMHNQFIKVNDKIVLLIDTTCSWRPALVPLPLDLVIISRKPRLSFQELQQTFAIKRVVFDGSVPLWKLNDWKKECDNLHIPYHDASEKGAFVMNVN